MAGDYRILHSERAALGVDIILVIKSWVGHVARMREKMPTGVCQES